MRTRAIPPSTDISQKQQPYDRSKWVVTTSPTESAIATMLNTCLPVGISRPQSKLWRPLLRYFPAFLPRIPSVGSSTLPTEPTTSGDNNIIRPIRSCRALSSWPQQSSTVRTLPYRNCASKSQRTSSDSDCQMRLVSSCANWSQTLTKDSERAVLRAHSAMKSTTRR